MAVTQESRKLTQTQFVPGILKVHDYDHPTLSYHLDGCSIAQA